MLEDFRKGLLAGFGALLLTKDKVEEVTRKLVNEAKLNQEDARKLTNELVEKGERQWSEMEQAVGDAVRRGLKNFGIGSHKELLEIKDKIESLEQRISDLENLLQTKG